MMRVPPDPCEHRHPRRCLPSVQESYRRRRLCQRAGIAV